MNIILYFGLCASGSNAENMSRLEFWVGILMLISAGSFLYVALIHILPEVYALEGDHDEDEHNHAPGFNHREAMLKKQQQYQKEHFSRSVELSVLMIGLFLPMALQFVPDVD